MQNLLARAGYASDSASEGRRLSEFAKSVSVSFGSEIAELRAFSSQINLTMLSSDIRQKFDKSIFELISKTELDQGDRRRLQDIDHFLTAYSERRPQKFKTVFQARHDVAFGTSRTVSSYSTPRNRIPATNYYRADAILQIMNDKDEIYLQLLESKYDSVLRCDGQAFNRSFWQSGSIQYVSLVLPTDNSDYLSFRQCIIALRRLIDTEPAIADDISRRIDVMRGSLDSEEKRINEFTLVNQSVSDSIFNEISGRYNRRLSLDDATIKIALPIVLFLFAIVILILGLIVWKVSDPIKSSIVNRGMLLEIPTVLLIVVTTLLLGISERLESATIGTLLGTIAGYVLGRAGQAIASSRRQMLNPVNGTAPNPPAQMAG